MRERLARALFRLGCKLDPCATIVRSRGWTYEVDMWADAKAIQMALLAMKRRNGGQPLGLG